MRDADHRERFLKLAREGRLGVQALYCNVLTGLCSHEEFCRLMYGAAKIHREHDVPYISAQINDVPTWVGGLPMVLAGSGIRYFAAGSNNTRGPTFTQMYDKCPCWWEGPDGSRVLTMFVPSYAYAQRMGLDANVALARQRILDRLQSYESRGDGYPYFDAIFLNGAVSDNCLLNAKLAEVCHKWNLRYAYPKIIVCHSAEFFEYIDKKYGDKLPVFRGSAGTYWEDGAGSSARETAMNRNAHEAIGAAERLLAWAGRLGSAKAYPRDAIDRAWRNAILYDEHTWGAHCSISQPESEFTKAQWRIKAQFAHDAHRQGKELLDEGAKALAGLVKTEGRSLVVINTLSWPRSDTVELALPAGATFADADVPCCRVGDKTLAVVPDVPSCGYRVLPLGPGTDVPQATEAQGHEIESRHYRVAFDTATGAITSLIDKQTGRELVDAASPYGLNQYLYVSGGDNSQIVHRGGPPELTIHTPKRATLKRFDLGPVGQRNGDRDVGRDDSQDRHGGHRVQRPETGRQSRTGWTRS